VKRPTLAASAPALADLSLNCTIRLASPNPVMHDSTQASSVCSGTWLCTNTIERSGSSPAAKSCAAATLVRRRRSAGCCGNVIACRSTTQYTVSCVSCSATHWRRAPR
jgi:hypothetical protein